MLEALVTSVVVPLLGELFKQFLSNLPIVISGLQQINTSTLTDSPADGVLQLELTHALDEAITAGAVPAP